MNLYDFMIHGGYVKGNGNDQFGEFDINGYENNGKVKFVKYYFGSHKIHYEGTLVDGKLEGTWNNGDIQDKFKLEMQPLLEYQKVIPPEG